MDEVLVKATLAEVDFLIENLHLTPGMRLLDVGCEQPPRGGACQARVQGDRGGYQQRHAGRSAQSRHRSRGDRGMGAQPRPGLCGKPALRRRLLSLRGCAFPAQPGGHLRPRHPGFCQNLRRAETGCPRALYRVE